MTAAIAALLFSGAPAVYAGGGSVTLTPANNIQAAINSGNFSEIVLSPGTYNQTIAIGAADAPLTLRCADPSDNATVAATILDGEFLGTSVILVSGAGADIVINGLTIINGEALGGAGPANRGGAIDCEAASPTIKRCVFMHNHADSAGGAFYVNAGNMTIEDCTFIDNDAPFGGAAYCNNSTVHFVRCTFDTNIASTEAGACRLIGGTYSLKACTFTGNTSVTFGGGIAVRSGANWNATQCWFEDNFSGDGGANGRGGAIYHDGSDSAFVDNCVFWNNSVSNFGASLYTVQDITLRNTTHYGETSSLSNGDVINVPPAGRIDMHNSIIWAYNASVAVAGGGIKNVTYSNIQGGYAGAGNIGDAPTFADAANGNFHLLDGSLGIDAGDATKVIGQYPVDFDGLPRALNDLDIVDTGVAVLGISVDMGAFEFQPKTVNPPDTCPADVAPAGGDNMVNVDDLLTIINGWGVCPK